MHERIQDVLSTSSSLIVLKYPVPAKAHGAQLVLAGVTDLSAEETGFTMPELGAALAGAPPNVPVVLLEHQPKNARSAAARGVALQLSGHTHGGLVVGLERIFGLANGGYVSGRYKVQGMTLYVNNGTALWVDWRCGSANHPS